MGKEAKIINGSVVIPEKATPVTTDPVVPADSRQ